MTQFKAWSRSLSVRKQYKGQGGESCDVQTYYQAIHGSGLVRDRTGICSAVAVEAIKPFVLRTPNRSIDLQDMKPFPF
jgi:hypothetical protein